MKWPNPSRRVLPVEVRPVSIAALPPYIRSVSILQPKGDHVAETVAAVDRLSTPWGPLRRTLQWAIPSVLAVVALVALSPSRRCRVRGSARPRGPVPPPRRWTSSERSMRFGHPIALGGRTTTIVISSSFRGSIDRWARCAWPIMTSTRLAPESRASTGRQCQSPSTSHVGPTCMTSKLRSRFTSTGYDLRSSKRLRN